ncbi:MAG: four-carbon acid sugar kinase family protein, partial [Bacteroidota bacterium]
MHNKIVPLQMLSDDQPIPDWTKRNVVEGLNAIVSNKADAIVVLDDDPTGTQTVYDTPVLTDWKVESIMAELQSGSRLFFILTNSRSLPEEDAEALAFEIGQAIRQAQEITQKRCFVISRGDSTLRGHYPGEVDALELGLQQNANVQVLIPAFFEGGRFTFSDIHYVRDAERLVPVAQSPYARDHYFGFQNSNLKAWVEEKTQGAVSQHQVVSISLSELRELPMEQLVRKINRCKPGSVLIVNATRYQDLQTFSLALFQSRIKTICRTAASFVAALSNQAPRPLLDRESFPLQDVRRGGLVVVGSYVSKSTRQLQYLQQHISADFLR